MSTSSSYRARPENVNDDEQAGRVVAQLLDIAADAGQPALYRLLAVAKVRAVRAGRGDVRRAADLAELWDVVTNSLPHS